MSLDACLVRLEADGTIDAERAARFRAEYARLLKANRKTMGAIAAAEAASRDTIDALDFQAMNDRRQAVMAGIAQRGLLTGLAQHLEDGGRAGQFAIGVMEHHEGVFGRTGVEETRGALFKLAWSRMGAFMRRYERDLLGRVRNGDELTDVVRELRGEPTGNVNASTMARAIADTMEWLRLQFNAAGGAIPKLDGWGLPQSHDALGVAQAGLEAWRAFIKPLLLPEKMIDNTTGKPFASEAALDEAIADAWKNIASEGMDGAVPGAFNGSGKLANRRADHRFFVFADADSWLKYNARFGTGDVFNSVVGHIDSMTRDIAAMRVLGPNPAHTIAWLTDVLHQQALPGKAGGKAAKLDGKARKGARTMERMWRYYSGELTAVAPENKATARFFAGLRNWNVMSKLGRAFLSAAPTDPVFKAMTAKFNGLPVARTIGDYLKTFNPADPASRAAAADAGLVFNEMTQRARKLWREGQGVDLVEMTRRGADGLLRTTLLSPHTLAAKQSLGLSFMRDWADHAGEAFDKLAPAKRTALERYGIDAADWDRLRGIGAEDAGGVKLLRPGDLARRGGEGDLDTAIKFMALIDSEGRFDTPSDQLRAQTSLALGGRGSALERGTVMGELAHSATQFKTYSVIMLTTHLMRMLYGRGGMNRATYAATMPVLLGVMGTLAYVLRTIASGEDPPPLDDWRTWATGFAVGGGQGFAGDIVNGAVSGQSSRTGAVASYMTGPTISAVVDPAINLTLGNIGQAARGEDTNIGRELARQARLNTPGGNAWYAQAAFNRMVMDRLQEIADPDYRQAYRRMERATAERGGGYWWRPGEGLPARAPDFANATGQGASR